MAGKLRQQIIREIECHVAANGGVFGHWFVGVTDRPKLALFTTHGLHPSGDPWISRKAADNHEALEAALYFYTIRNTRGSSNGHWTSPDHLFVYAYKMKAHTNP